MNTRAWIIGAMLLLASTACAGDAAPPTEPTGAMPTGGSDFLVASNTWRTRAAMWGSERSNLAATSLTNAAGQSVLYAIGGRSPADQPLPLVMAYNVKTNVWNLKAKLPTPLAETNGAAVLKGKIYLSGGCAFESGDCHYEGYSSRLYVYDPARDTWSSKRNMPQMGAFGVSGVIGDRLYVLTECIVSISSLQIFSDCGDAGLNGASRFFRYDPATDRWSTLPRPLGFHRVGAVVDGKFYTIDGTMEVYDPATNRWTTRPTPTPAGSPPNESAAAVLHGRLYLVGAQVQGHPDETADTLRTTWEYSPATDRWTAKAAMPTVRFGIAAHRVDLDGQQLIEVVGGARPGNNLQFAP